VATNYLWCAERARLAGLALLIALVVNVALAAWLLPHYGLFGAAWATAAANFAMLVLMYASAWSCGMRFDRGVCLTALAPLALSGGPWTSLSALTVLALAALSGQLLFTTDEQRELASAFGRITHRLRRQASNSIHTATVPSTK
jgi:O-antigen/teichoic acid export membrane protein